MKRTRLLPLGVVALLLAGVSALAQPSAPSPEATPHPDASAPCVEPFTAAMDCLQEDDPKGAADRLAPLAQAGEPRAMFALALLHDLGAGVRIDHERARTLLEGAATKDFAPAIHYLAWKHKVGFGVDRESTPDDERARITQRAEQTPIDTSGVPPTWLELQDGQLIPNFRHAYLWMFEAAGTGDVVAMANLSTALFAGPWTRPNPMGHVLWLQKAAEAGDGPSAERLTLYYGIGMLVPEDEEKSAYWMRRAAEAGSAKAQYSLARDLARGKGGQSANQEEAATWYEKAAAQGHVEAMLAFGRMLREGQGVAQNHRRACEMFQAAAEHGEADGYAELGWMIERGLGTPRDLPRARDAFRKALELGDDWAGRALGDILQKPAFAPTDWTEVRAAYSLGAERGSEVAMIGLGTLCYGGKGEPANHEAAFIWYERAARGGNAWAQNRVGSMLQQGDGIERDHEEAVSWFRLAAQKGNTTAKANLGYHLAVGLGVERDAVPACENLLAALADAKNAWVVRTLVTLIKTASPEELAAMRPMLDPILAEDRAGDPVLAGLALWMLFDGPEGLRNPDVARARLEKRAEAGDVGAMADASLRSLLGNGLPRDVAAARAWARRAATRDAGTGATLEARIDIATGDAATRAAARATLETLADKDVVLANQTLGYLCATGEGLPVDLDRAWKCAEVLARLGSKKAREALPLKETDSPGGLRRCFGAVAAPMPDPLVMAGRVAQRNALQLLPGSPVVAVHRVDPIYPKDLKAAGITGSATVEFFVNTDGRPEDVHCIESTHPLFAAAAETAIHRWWFAPARVEGEPIRTTVRQLLTFELSNDPLELDLDES